MSKQTKNNQSTPQILTTKTPHDTGIITIEAPSEGQFSKAFDKALNQFIENFIDEENIIFNGHKFGFPEKTRLTTLLLTTTDLENINLYLRG